MNDSRNDDTPHIPGYDISRRLGRGGMADVYLALQSSLSRPVAIKVLAAERTQGEETVTRFEQEARTIARLDHPNIVSIFDVGRTDDGRLYYVMPYLPNGDLSTRDLREDEAGVVEILRALLHALGYAHKLGIVHRDVKPENVLFDKLDRPLLADFGIALASADFARVTREGSTIGSSGYMSPEQSRGFAIDGRSDLYSLGVVAYEMLSGELPYKGPDTLAVALAHVEQPIPRLPPRRRRWQAFIDKALAKSPDERFQSAEQMEAALDALDPQTAMMRDAAYETKPLPTLAEQPRSRLPATVLVAVLLTLAGAAMIVYALRDLRSAPARIESAAGGAAVDVASAAAARVGTAPANAQDAATPVVAASGPDAPAATATPAESAVDAPAGSTAKPDDAPAASAKSSEAGERKEPDKETPPRVRLESLAAGTVLRDRGGPTLVFVPEKGARDGKGGGFALARYETTRRDYAAFVEATGREAAKCREPHSPLSAFRKYSWREPGFEQEDSHPVVCVTWADANAYVQWLSTRTHARYRLPTHAEWLQALRSAPEKTDACAQGNLADDKRAVLRGNEDGCSDGFAHTAPVGKFKPNRLGLYDLVGNASEWTLDCKGGDAKSDDGAACPQRMFSGRSWRDDAGGGVDGQDDAGADIGYTTIGFRVLRELTEDDVPPLVR
jgi:formylglycine-generating enzyme required for sulfatase activity